MLAQQGLATGEAKLFRAMRHKDLGKPKDLFKAEEGGLRQKLVIVVEDGFRHAVRAAEIATIGH